MSESYEYVTDSSEYVSSVMTDEAQGAADGVLTPFPSLTKSQKLKILQSIRQEQVSTFTEQIDVPEEVTPPQTENVEVKNSCCCLC